MILVLYVTRDVEKIKKLYNVIHAMVGFTPNVLGWIQKSTLNLVIIPKVGNVFGVYFQVVIHLLMAVEFH
jgi:hypothetical protein